MAAASSAPARRRLVRNLHRRLRMQRVDNDGAVGGRIGAHHDIAWKQQADLVIDIDGTMGWR
nr:hypothetical protein [Mycolicibacterium chlorophenolicum]